MLASLVHPNLPRVTDYFDSLGKHYLVMDFIDGDTLQRLQQRINEPLPQPQVIAWALQLCDILIYLHSQTPPVIFRDLKPSNIMIESAGQIRLIDFGIARLFKPGRSQDTIPLGTDGYAPPEQHGKAQSDPRVDIYALGVTLYELLTRYDPTSHPYSLPPIHEINPGISEELASAIMRAIALDATQRWQTASEFKTVLIDYQRGLHQNKPHTARLKVSVLLEPQRIDLNCTLQESKEKVLAAKRRMTINQLAGALMEQDPFECKFIALLGYPGAGTSEICRRAKEIVGG